jgi:tetratricopeptide (TPR) repeat protein
MIRQKALLAVLTIAACGMRPDVSGVALAAEIQAGDWVVTVDESVPVMVESNTLFVLARNTELAVEQVNGDWIAVTVTKGGKEVRGWVERSRLARIGQPSEVRRKFAKELASVPAEKRYTAFSLNAARKKIQSTSVPGAIARALLSQKSPPTKDPEVEYLGGMNYVRGLVIDPKTGDAIVVGQYIPGRERLALDDLVVALRARFVHGQWPVVSIDPPPQKTNPPYHNVRFEGGVRDTAFGLTLFEADYLLKKVGQGHVATGVPEVPSEWSLWVKQARSQYADTEVNIGGRVWFYPDVAATPVRENVAAYSGLKVGVYYEVLSATIGGRRIKDLTEIKSPTGEQFVALIRQHYEPLAAMHPSWRRIMQLNELVALSRAIEVMERRPDLGWWLESYPITSVETPRQARELSRSQAFNEGYYSHTVSTEGGVELRAMALRLEAGDVSALADAALSTRPGLEALTWGFVVDDWVIAIPPELDITKGAEVTPQLVYAQFLTRQGKYDEAVARLDKVLAIQPSYVDALLLKGNLLSDALKRYDDAIACFSGLIQKLPDCADAYSARGLARARKNDLHEAIEDFNGALKVNPKLVGALAYRGVCYGNSGDPEKAVADLTEAIRLDPTVGIVYAWRGNIHGGEGRQDNALADFNEAIRRAPKEAFAYASRGRLYQAQREHEKALADLTEAIRLDSTDLSYYATRAAICDELGKHSDAVADYSAILDRDSSQTEARWRRSEAYRKSHQFQKALEDCAKLNLLLFVEVTPESAPLQSGEAKVGTVYQGEEVKVMQTNGDWLWVEAVLSSGKVLQGWIDQKHVR